MAKCISTILTKEDYNIDVQTLLDKGNGPYEILKSTMKNCNVLDLSGCNLTEVLYYVSQGNPVLAITGPDDATLIVGYDGGNIVTYNPNNGSYIGRSMIDAAKTFEANNNAFISYVKK